MPGIVLRFHDSKHIWGRYDYSFHFTDEKGEALRGQSHRSVWARICTVNHSPMQYAVTLLKGVMAGTYGRRKIRESWKVWSYFQMLLYQHLLQYGYNFLMSVPNRTLFCLLWSEHLHNGNNQNNSNNRHYPVADVATFITVIFMILLSLSSLSSSLSSFIEVLAGPRDHASYIT